MIDPLAHTSGSFTRAARERGLAADEALRVYRSIFRAGVDPGPPCSLRLAPIVRGLEEAGTSKFVLRFGDGLECESVIIPSRGRTGQRRETLCLSSQIGCAMGCVFCETAQMGRLRNLDPGEIIAQWHAARFRYERTIRNIVFMGMGEPLDNLEAVWRSIEILCDRNGPSIAASRITVSTVGRADAIRTLSDRARAPGYGRLRLAVSVNAPNDVIRTSIMPLNRAVPMADLTEATRSWTDGGSRRILIEYVLIPTVNDALEHARELCEYLRPLACTVNVIPHNPRRQSPWPAPEESAVERFIEEIARCGQPVRRRQTRGRSVMAGCGQLGNEALSRRRVGPAVR